MYILVFCSIISLYWVLTLWLGVAQHYVTWALMHKFIFWWKEAFITFQYFKNNFLHSLSPSLYLSLSIKKRLNKELNINVRSIFFEMIRERLQVKYRYFYILESDSRETKLIIYLVIYINSFWCSMSLLCPSIDKTHFISKAIWDMFNFKNQTNTN